MAALLAAFGMMGMPAAAAPPESPQLEITENLGCQVDWDGSANMVKVTYPKP